MVNVFDKPGPSRTGVDVLLDSETHEYRGRIVTAYPKDGAGNLYVFVQFDGKSNTASCGGYGYDKKSAAIETAMQKMGFDALPHFGGCGDSAVKDVFLKNFKIEVVGLL
jgi:hypothetical protein